MAKFADYVKEDELDQEISEAGQAQEERKVNVPESVAKRFEGKSPVEIMESYAELEKAYSTQGQKTGELRKAFDEYINLQSQQEAPPEPEPEPVTVDDLYDDAEGTIARVVAKTTNNRIDDLEAQIAQRDAREALSAFENQYPDWQETAQSDKFKEWLNEKPHRMKLAQKADKFDFEAADELFGLYSDHVSTSQEVQAEAERERQLNAATLETSSPESPAMEQRFSRTEIIQRRIAATNGDPESRNWLAVNGNAIRQAYETGNVTD